jgi:allantoin racemase
MQLTDWQSGIHWCNVASMPRIAWQGFTDSVANEPYVDRLVVYLNELADPGFSFEFSGITPPDYHVHRLTELRCSVQAVSAAIELERDGVDAVVLGHFQDAGLWELRSTLTVPVIGLGESSMLWGCQLGYRFGLITIHPNFREWHEQQVRAYSITERCAGVRAMETGVDVFMDAFAGGEESCAHIESQFEALGRELVAAGAEVLIPAGGLPALLLGTRDRYTVDGAVVLNANAVAAKQAEVAVKMRALCGSEPCRTGTFRRASAEAVHEFVTLARAMGTNA